MDPSTQGTQTTAPPPRESAGGVSTAAPRVVLTILQRKLLEIISAGFSRQKTFAEIMQVVLGVMNAAAVLYFQRDVSGRLVLGPKLRHPWFGLDERMIKKLVAWSAETAQNDSVQFHPLDTHEGLTAVSVPVTRDGQAADVLVALLTGADQPEYFAAVLQLVGSYLTLWHFRNDSNRAEWEARAAAALVELVTRIQTSEQSRQACYRLVNEMEQYLGCRRVAVALQPPKGDRCRLTAISGMAQFDPRSEIARYIEAVLHETIVRGGITTWPAAESNRHATLAHQKLAKTTACEAIISAPLRDMQGELVGAWVFMGDAAWGRAPESAHMVQASGPHVATCLEMVRRHERGPLWRAANLLWRKRRSWQAGAVACAAVVMLGVLMIPMPYRMTCKTQLQPVSRRFVAAPFATKLQSALVEPGDRVEAGQLLAQLDGRELRFELASQLAEHDRADKQRRVAMAEQDAPAAQQAELEMQRLHLQIQLLEHRSQTLEITSPVDGVVIAGDLKKAEGVPLETGQTLFELAPLEQVRLEIAVPDEDIAYVTPGCRVEVRIDSAPQHLYEAEIRRIHPQAEVHDGENVFLAEAILDNARDLLRPGMKGRVTIIGPRHSLAWNYFHKPWEYLCRAWGD
jgi:multidrug resistance efflux pump